MSRRRPKLRRAVVALAALAAAALVAAALVPAPALAGEFRLQEVKSLAEIEPAKMQPHTVYFSDHETDRPSDGMDGLIRFEDWARSRPLEKQILSPYPSYAEPTVKAGARGGGKARVQKLHMFIAEARFLLSKPAASIELARYVKLDFVKGIDPAVTHKAIAQSDVVPLKDPDYAQNGNPDRKWCEPGPAVNCIESRYQLEGKLPVGIRLVNKLSEGKKIAEFVRFQSELRALSAEAGQDYPNLPKLTGIDSPVAGVLEQNIFYVNQIMQFGKILAVFQPQPGDAGKTVVTAYIAIAVKTDVLDKRKEFAHVPVLRNLIPLQVLMGNSSFNTGSSISAGLPAYARNRAKAIASILDASLSD